MNMILPLICATTIAVPIATPSETDADVVPTHPNVWLDGHRGVYDASAKPPTLRLQALGHNSLNLPIESIEIGVLFAADQETLATADLARLYQPEAAAQRDDSLSGDTSTTAQTDIGAFRQWVDVRIEPTAEAAISLSIVPHADGPEPATWVTHVLGYRLAEVDAKLFMELLHTDVFIDEVAVVETLALTNASRKSEVRSRWGQHTDFVTALIATATAKPPVNPNFQDALDRVMAIRALGVLGGPLAKSALESLLTSSVLDPLDEPLLVVSIARLRNTPLEAPLAFAVPRQSKRMRDVVTAALDDVVGRIPPPAPTTAEPESDSADNAAAESPEPSPKTESTLEGETSTDEPNEDSRLTNLALAATALAILLLIVAFFNRWRRTA